MLNSTRFSIQFILLFINSHIILQFKKETIFWIKTLCVRSRIVHTGITSMPHFSGLKVNSILHMV